VKGKAVWSFTSYSKPAARNIEQGKSYVTEGQLEQGSDCSSEYNLLNLYERRHLLKPAGRSFRPDSSYEEERVEDREMPDKQRFTGRDGIAFGELKG